MNLRRLSDTELLSATRNLAAEERRLTIEVLHHLREVERRRLHASLGYSSLFEYCISELGYPAGSAQRRIASMRLLRELPELEEKIESGALNLSLVSQVSTFLRREEISEPEKKREVIAAVTGKSCREAEKELALLAKEPEKLVPARIRPVTQSLSELTLLVDQGILDELDELRDLLGHQTRGASMQDLIRYAVSLALKKHRIKAPDSQSGRALVGGNANPAPLPPTSEASPSNMPGNSPKPVRSLPASEANRKTTIRKHPVPANSLPTSEVNRRTATARDKRLVWHRDGGRCTYVSSSTGRRCTSRYALQLDHIVPYAQGGKTEPENLRLRCPTHNLLAAIQTFGPDLMRKYTPSLR